MATHSSVLAWRIPGTAEPVTHLGRLQSSMGHLCHSNSVRYFSDYLPGNLPFSFEFLLTLMHRHCLWKMCKKAFLRDDYTI